MLRTAFFTLCTSLVVTAACGADVYKYTDEKGNIQYTDRPLTLPAQRLNIQSQRTDVVELEERNNEPAKTAATTKTPQQAQQGADKPKTDTKKPDALPAEFKTEACNKARQDYLSRMTAHRVYEEDAKGERHFLSSEELDASRAAAKSAMDTLCN